jgi:hypothetical protein
MKASRSGNAVLDFQSYADCKDLQFIAVVTALALVLATSVAGAAVGQPASQQASQPGQQVGTVRSSLVLLHYFHERLIRNLLSGKLSAGRQ